MKLDDKILVAYVDGELEAEAVREVEAALADDADVRARVQEFRDTTNRMREAFKDLIRQPAPQKLLEAAKTLEAEIEAQNKTAEQARGLIDDPLVTS